MKLFIIRHGESTGNSQGIMQGKSNPHLSSQGRKQAQQLARYLISCKIDKLFTSNLSRAYQTAKILSQGLKKPVVKVPLLQEVGLGMWEGRKFKDLNQDQRKLYKKWFDAPSKIKIPGAEKINNFSARISEAFNDIIHSADDDENIVIVTHGGVICAYLSKILNADIDKMLVSIRLDNAGVTIVEIFDKSFFWVRTVNHTAHLSPDGAQKKAIKFP